MNTYQFWGNTIPLFEKLSETPGTGMLFSMAEGLALSAYQDFEASPGQQHIGGLVQQSNRVGLAFAALMTAPLGFLIAEALGAGAAATTMAGKVVAGGTAVLAADQFISTMINPVAGTDGTFIGSALNKILPADRQYGELIAGGLLLTQPAMALGRLSVTAAKAGISSVLTGGQKFVRNSLAALSKPASLIADDVPEIIISSSINGAKGEMPPVMELPASGLSSASRATKGSVLRGAGMGMGLPQTGRIRFVPPKGFNPADGLVKGELNGRWGYRDRHGNFWVPDLQKREWDVQLGRAGQRQLQHLSKSGRHINVNPQGKITH